MEKQRKNWRGIKLIANDTLNRKISDIGCKTHYHLNEYTSENYTSAIIWEKQRTRMK
jgi:hypothetical protein